MDKLKKKAATHTHTAHTEIDWNELIMWKFTIFLSLCIVKMVYAF